MGDESLARAKVHPAPSGHVLRVRRSLTDGVVKLSTELKRTEVTELRPLVPISQSLRAQVSGGLLERGKSINNEAGDCVCWAAAPRPC